MTTQFSHVSTLSPDRLAEPPPFAFELFDADRAVGWVHGDTIGFHGFADEREATHAAWVAHRTISRRLARRDGRRPIPIDAAPLALDRRRGVERILASGRPIATLVRPTEPLGTGGGRDDDGRGDGVLAGASYGFAMRVPSPADELTMRALAYLVYRTLRKSGLRWAMWAPRPERSAPRRPSGAQPSAPDASDVLSLIHI